WGGGGGGQRGSRQGARHGRGRAIAAEDVAFGQELLVRQDDRVARDLEIGRELPRGRQPRCGCQTTVADHRLEREIDTPIEGPVGFAQVEQEHLETGSFNRPESGARYAGQMIRGGNAAGKDVQTLEELNRGYVRAGQTSDVGWFDKNLAACFMASNPDGSLIDRAGFLERIGRPNPSKNMAAVDTRARIVG